MKIINKALYIALGVNFQGKKDVLGFWIADTDGITGFPDAIRAVYSQTRVQLCIVHMIRNSTKYVSYKDLKSVYVDLKAIYNAASEKTDGKRSRNLD